VQCETPRHSCSCVIICRDFLFAKQHQLRRAAMLLRKHFYLHFPALSRLLLDSLTKLQTWRTEVCVLQPLVCLCSAHQFRALLLSLPVKSLMILASCMGLSFAVLILACAFYSNWLPMTMCECEVFRVIVLVARWCGPDTSVSCRRVQWRLWLCFPSPCCSWTCLREMPMVMRVLGACSPCGILGMYVASSLTTGVVCSAGRGCR